MFIWCLCDVSDFNVVFYVDFMVKMSNLLSPDPSKLQIFQEKQPTEILVYHSGFTLWWTNVAIENGDLVRGFSHEKWWIFPLLC